MKVRIVMNDIIPFEGFKAVTIIPWIFCRKALNDVDVNHELIHVRQQAEMLVVGVIIAVALFFVLGWWSLLALPIFFWLYLLEWLIRLLIYWNQDEAYRNISFEQEAYDHEQEHCYLSVRKRFAFLRYLFKKSYERK